MSTDATYAPGIYRKNGGKIMVIGDQGQLNVAAGGTATTTGTLSAQTTSATLTGNDTGGTISIVTTATGSAANVNLFIVTFATAKANAPMVFLQNLTPGAGSATTYSGSFGALPTTAGFTVQCLAAVTASSTIVLGYLVVGIE